MRQQDLAKGQLTPQAKPVSSFLSFRNGQPAAPNQGARFGSPSQVNIIQRSNEMSVQGVNSAAELAQALRPLTKLADVGLEMYASDQYQRGQNEVMRASQLINRQIQQSEIEYAGQNRSLSRQNPVAGVLMDQTNPFRQAGRVNQASQLAAQQMPSLFRKLWVEQGAALVTQDPGSPLLNQARANAVTQFAQSWGLDEFSPGFQDYVVPVMNREWEAFQDKHLKARTDHLKVAHRQLTQQQLFVALMGWDPNKTSRSELMQQGGSILASNAMRLGLDGEPTKFTKDVLLGLQSQLEVLSLDPSNPMAARAVQALELIGGLPTGVTGLDGKPIPAGQAYALDLLKGSDEVGQLGRRRQEREIAAASRGFENRYGSALAGLTPGSVEHSAVLNEAVQDPEFGALSRSERVKLLTEMTSVESNFAGIQVNDNLIQDQFLIWEGQYGSAWSEADARARFNALMAQLPGAASEEKKKYRSQFQSLIKAKRSEQSGAISASLMNANLTSALKSELAARYPDITPAALQGVTNLEGLLAYGDQQRKASTQEFSSEFRRRAYAAIRGEAAKQGVAELPEEQQQAVLDRVLKEMRADKELMNRVFPPIGSNKAPAAGPNGTQAAAPTAPPGRKPSQAKPFPISTLNSAPQERIDQWQSEPLISAQDAEGLLAKALNGEKLPTVFQRAATRAGVSPEELLLKQADLYPQYAFGLTPELRNRLMKKGNRAGGATQALLGAPPASADASSILASYNRSMGNILAGRVPRPTYVFNPGADYSLSPAGTAYTSSDSRAQSLIAMASRLGVDPGDLAAIFSFETGGTLDPNQPGYGAAAGRIGLIQAGPNERAAYGLGSGNWEQEMLGVERYMKDRGVKPGMGLPDLYAAVNGGNVGAGWSPDGNGTVARSASTQRALQQHRTQAMSRLGLTPQAAPRLAGFAPLTGARTVRRSELGSGFGAHESFRRHPHEGIDVKLASGSAIGLSVPVTVVGVNRSRSTRREANGGYGAFIDVRLPNGNVVRWAHLSEIASGLKPGQQIPANTMLARTGGRVGAPGSGRSGGDHLHMELLRGAGGTEQTLRGKIDPVRNGATQLLVIGNN